MDPKKYEEIEDLIIENEIGAALKAMRKVVKEIPKLKRYDNDIIMQLARWNQNQRSAMSGVASAEFLARQEARIREAALYLMGILQKVIEEEEAAILEVIDASDNGGKSAEEILEKITGNKENFKPITWLIEGYKKSASICRIIDKNYNPHGTGFLIGNGYIMTNNHVIDSLAKAQNMLAQFDYQIGENKQPKSTVEFEFTPNANEFQTSAINDSDYTIIRLNEVSNEKALTDYGHLEFSETMPEVSDPVNIIQHPNGGLKQIALTDNEVTEIVAKSIEYKTDTLPGSSGSPVLNNDWKVVGLHRGAPRGKDANIATRIDFIVGEIEVDYKS